jgi:hypothetical protein
MQKKDLFLNKILPMKTTDIIAQIEEIMNQEEFSDLDLEQLWELKEWFNSNIERMVGLIDHYRWLEEESKVIKEKAWEREKFYKNSQERMKNIISFFMHKAWKDKLETGSVRLSFRPSEKVLIINEDMIPVEFKELIVKEEIKINKTEIKNFLKTLKEDEWCSWAYLEKNQNLQIK